MFCRPVAEVHNLHTYRSVEHAHTGDNKKNNCASEELTYVADACELRTRQWHMSHPHPDPHMSAGHLWPMPVDEPTAMACVTTHGVRPQAERTPRRLRDLRAAPVAAHLGARSRLAPLPQATLAPHFVAPTRCLLRPLPRGTINLPQSPPGPGVHSRRVRCHAASGRRADPQGEVASARSGERHAAAVPLLLARPEAAAALLLRVSAAAVAQGGGACPPQPSSRTRAAHRHPPRTPPQQSAPTPRKCPQESRTCEDAPRSVTPGGAFRSRPTGARQVGRCNTTEL